MAYVEQLAAAVRGATSSRDKSAEQIKAGLEAIAKQKRKVTVGGETFISEPVEDFNLH